MVRNENTFVLLIQPELLVSCMQKLARSEDQDVDLVCFGIGSVASSANAQYQCALLLGLRQTIENTLGVTVHACAFDPILGPQEKAALTKLHIKALDENHEGKWTAKRTTIFFMVHCGAGLYNNVIWANWLHMDRIVIIGNSFQKMSVTRPDAILTTMARYTNAGRCLFMNTDMVQRLSCHHSHVSPPPSMTQC